MTTLKTSELTDAALDWAVCLALGRTDMRIDPDDGEMLASDDFDYSTEWSHGGPIIDREGLCLIKTGTVWQCTTNGNELHSHAKEGPTPLIAAMRCYVASKMGDTIDVPSDLV